MARNSSSYILGFITAVCLVCGAIVASSAVLLKDRQVMNKQLDRKKKVLTVAQLMTADQQLTPQDIDKLFADNITPKLVDLDTGKYAEVSAEVLQTFDQRVARQDPETSKDAPDNPAKVLRVPNQALVYLKTKGSETELLILPIEGKGLWSTLYGFLALEKDTTSVAGITFYEHLETPGLGGEIENPTWVAKWPGRKAFDESWKPKIDVIKGAAGPAAEDPYRIDGLSGATITGRGVGHLVRFWLEEDRFGRFLSNFRNGTLTTGGNG